MCVWQRETCTGGDLRWKSRFLFIKKKESKSSLRSFSILNPFEHFKALCRSPPAVPLQWLDWRAGPVASPHPGLLGEKLIKQKSHVWMPNTGKPILIVFVCRDSAAEAAHLSCCFRVWSRAPTFCEESGKSLFLNLFLSNHLKAT